MNTGFTNEDELKKHLHNKYYKNLNNNLKNLIDDSFKNKEGVIKCIKNGGTNKSDLLISINSESHTYSIKKGTGNSVHQEPVGSFIDYLSDTFGITVTTQKNILKFIWGDGTLDGISNGNNRLSASQFAKKYPEVIDDIQNYFNKIKRPLIKRFIITGANGSIPADYIYYGDYENGFCCDSSSLLDWLESNNSNGAISIGRLTFQAWNRNLNCGNFSEHKRGVIQLKWGTLRDDIKLI